MFPSLPGFGPETTGASCHWLGPKVEQLAQKNKDLARPVNWGNLQELKGKSLGKAWFIHAYTCLYIHVYMFIHVYTIRIYEV